MPWMAPANGPIRLPGGGTIAMPAQRLVAAPHRPTATRSKGLEAVSLPIVVASTA